MAGYFTAYYNAAGGYLKVIDKPIIPSHKLVKYYLHLLLPIFPADGIGANIAILRK